MILGNSRIFYKHSALLQLLLSSRPCFLELYEISMISLIFLDLLVFTSACSRICCFSKISSPHAAPSRM